MVDKTVNILTRVIPRKPRSKNYQGSGITNIATYSKGASSGESTASTPHPTIEVVSKESYAALTDDNVLSSLRTLQEILNRIISSTSGIDASDENTYSALKIDSDFKNIENTISELDTRFLSKVEPDSTEHLITFLAGLKLGTKYSIDENGNAQLNDIKASIVDGITALLNQIEATKLNATQADINNLTAFTLLVKSLADVENLNVKDTAAVLDTVVKQSLTSPKFISGFLGEGFRLAKTESGDWNLEIDNLTVRKVFQVFELIAQRIVYQGGMIIRSAAGGKITRITDFGTSWKCEHDGLDDFFKDDQVLCQKFKVKQGAKVKRYWRLAVEAGPGYVCLSKTDSEKDSSTPEVGDETVQLGNRTNAARQNAQLVSIIGKDAPYIDDYIGINSYSLENKLVQRSGNLAGIIDKEFGQLKGNGIYSQNAYLKGSFNLRNGKSVETVISETSNKLSSDIGKVQADLQKDINTSVSSVKNELGATITNVENNFNTSLNSTKNELNSSFSKVQGDADTAKGLAQQAQESIDGLEIRVRNLAVYSEVAIYIGGRIKPNDGTYKVVDLKTIEAINQPTSSYAIGFSLKNINRQLIIHGKSNLFNERIWVFYNTNTEGVWSGQKSNSMLTNNVGGFEFKLQPVGDEVLLGVGHQQHKNYTISELVIQQGNKPTDWSPAPEDTEAQITETNAKLGVLNDQLLAEVSKTNGISKDLAAVKLDHNSFKVQVKSDITGAINSNNELIKSSFEMKDNKISLLGAEIDITGKVTFRALDSSTQSQINTAGTNANKAMADAGKAQTSADTANSSITALKGSLGGLAYEDRVELAKLGTTVIEGGFLKTDLIRANSIKAEKLDIKSLEAVRIRTSNLDVLSGATIAGFKVGEGTITSDPIEGQKWENLVIRKDFFKVGGTNGYPMLGEDVMPASLGNAFTAVARFENKQPNKIGFDNENIGLYVDVNGGDKNTTLYLRGGGVSGFGLTVRFLGNWVASLDNYNERWTDFNKVDDNSSIYYSDVTSGKLGIRLPYPSDTWAGRVIRFCAVNSDIYFHVGREGMNGKKYILKTDGTKHTRLEISRGGIMELTNTGNYWHYMIYR